MFNPSATLLLIDGSSYMYRAFYAIRALSSPQNEPTNALYGVLNMLKKIEAEEKVTDCAFIIDAKGKNFRHELSADYKATRKPMPEELRPQAEWIRELVALMGWNVLSIPGVEADDVIATLTRRAKAEGLSVLISTGDKDMAQLVDDKVTIINTMTDERLDRDGVKKKYGVYPEQIVDFLSLTGDQSDNVKGVEKCGAKTAAKWLAEYHDLDTLLAHAEDIKGKIGDNLRAAAAWLPLSKELITLNSDVDSSEALPEGLAGLKKKPADWALLLPRLRHFGFKKWSLEAERKLNEAGVAIPSAAANEAKSAESQQGGHSSSLFPDTEKAPEKAENKELYTHDPHYAGVVTRAEFDALEEKLKEANIVAVDTETTSLNEAQARLVGLSFSFHYGTGYYVPVAHQENDGELSLDLVLARLKPYLENPALGKIGQNIKYDQHVLLNHGIGLQGVAGDSMLASYVVESHLGHGLDELARRHLGLTTITYEEICGKGAGQISFAEVPIKTAIAYAAEDADVTLRLERVLTEKMDAAEVRLYRDLELPISTILLRMERTGVLVDTEQLERQSRDLGARMKALEEEVYDLAGEKFNLNSPKQLQEILFGRLNIPTAGLKKTPKGVISTGEEVLSRLAESYPVPRLILEYRTLAKLKSTYLDKLPHLTDEEGRVHTTYAQAVVNTGRLASNNPNLQNIPARTKEGRKIREAFVAPSGHVIVSADYSQIELRIMAHLSGDERLIAAFQHNEDIHASTAAEVFHIPQSEVTPTQRRYAKTINFGLIYGMGRFGLARALDISNTEAQTFIDRYFQRYPGVAAYMERAEKTARAQGYVTTLFGRKLYLPNLYAANGNLRAGAARAAINAPMQGTAADLIKMAMIATQNWLDENKHKTKMVLQVHDELVFEVPENELDLIMAHIPPLMTEVARLKVPLVVDIGAGKNWEAAH